MSLHRWLQNLRSALAPGRGQRKCRRRFSARSATYRPYIEGLEERLTLSFTPYPVDMPPQADFVPPWEADFNNDGQIDLATVEWGSDHVSVRLGNGDGTYQPPLDVATGTNTQQVAVGDFTSDGIPDLIARGDWGWWVKVLPGRGDATFATPISTSEIGGEWFPAVDFNGDGLLDVFTAAGGAGDNFSAVGSVFLGQGDGTFQYRPEYYSLPGLDIATAVGTADFNDDGCPDLVVEGLDYDGQDAVTFLLNDGYWGPPLPPPPPPPSVDIGDVVLTEGNAGVVAAEFIVTLSGASNETITVAYATGDGTASAGSDYDSVSGTLTIPAGQTTGTIIVMVNGDRVAESMETFVVNLSSPTSAIVTDTQGVATIIDDEPRITISDVTKKEGNGKKTTLFAFTVTLSAAYDEPVTMSFATMNGTAMTDDQDYVAKSGTLTFLPGETTKTITIEVKGDNKKEANETFFLDLFDLSSNALFTKNRGLGTIPNDD